jgi:hypothetical protein
LTDFKIDRNAEMLPKIILWPWCHTWLFKPILEIFGNLENFTRIDYCPEHCDLDRLRYLERSHQIASYELFAENVAIWVAKIVRHKLSYGIGKL